MKTYAIYLSRLPQGASPLIRGNNFGSAYAMAVAYVNALGGFDDKAIRRAAACCLYGGKALPAIKTAGRNARALRRLSGQKRPGLSSLRLRSRGREYGNF